MSDRTRDSGPQPRDTDTSPTSESALDPTGTQGELLRGSQGHVAPSVPDREGDRAASGGREIRDPELRDRAARGEREDAPELGPARLGDLHGIGILTVVRDANGSLVDANGTWREEVPTLSFEELQARLPGGSAMTYEGPMIGRTEGAQSEQVRLQVVVTRHGEYEDYEGNAIRLVNFVAHELD